MTTVQLADADRFLHHDRVPPLAGRRVLRLQYAISCVSPSCVEFCVSSIGRSKCQSSNTILEDWYSNPGPHL
jgi:hypothetical protein